MEIRERIGSIKETFRSDEQERGSNPVRLTRSIKGFIPGGDEDDDSGDDDGDVGARDAGCLREKNFRKKRRVERPSIEYQRRCSCCWL